VADTRVEVRSEIDEWIAHYDALTRNFGGDEDLPELRRRLRMGRFADAKALECRRLDPRAVDQMSWLRIQRALRPEAGQRDAITDVVAGLARARTRMLFLVQGASRGIHLALPDDQPELVDWTRSVLAPGTLVEELSGQPTLPLDSSPTNGLRFSLVPQRQSERRESVTSLPGLARLLLSPGEDWSFLMQLDPVPRLKVIRLRASLVACSTKLAMYGGTYTEGADQRHTVTVERPEVSRLIEHLTVVLDHIEGGESAGLWLTTIHLMSTRDPDVDMLTSVAGSVLEEEPFSGGRWVADRLVAEEDPNLPPPTTLLSTLDIGAFLAPPRASVPGLNVAPPPPAGRTELRSAKSIPLGHWSGIDAEFAIGLEDLEGHGFITGTTGSGKSTTVQRLLAELWNRHQKPFLVIDPVKADYEAVAPMIDGGLLTVDAADLRLNALEPYGGFPVRVHLELVANAFKGSFTMPSPVPYIVAQLFELLVGRADAEPPPTFHELRDMLDPYVASLGYDPEITSNIRASLGTRLSLLLAPMKAERLAAPVSHGLNELFRQPAVVQLANLGDDEERSFLMSLLTLYVAERARDHGGTSELRHVTVLEEAHRILPEPQQRSDPEAGDAASVSSRLLTQMLAEIRSYGEAVLVVDQSPSAVARDVVKNTNLKIVHRVLDPGDREVIGGSIGISDEQQESLARLDRGEAVVLTRRLPEPQTVKIGMATPGEDGAGSPSRREKPNVATDTRPCCLGDQPWQHHAAERQSRLAESAMGLAIAGLIVGAGREPKMWQEVDRQLDSLTIQDPFLARAPQMARRCLAWVGMRRSLLQFVDFGMISAEDFGKLLGVGFSCWQNRRSHAVFEKLRTRDRDRSGPYYGCRKCDTVCLFRHFSSTSQLYGLANARTVLDPLWLQRQSDVQEAIAEWALEIADELTPLLGNKRFARGAALCAVTHLLHQLGAPLAQQVALVDRDALPEETG
jgi:hypothetical protein